MRRHDVGGPPAGGDFRPDGVVYLAAVLLGFSV
jgi:hypothetical protein